MWDLSPKEATMPFSRRAFLGAAASVLPGLALTGSLRRPTDRTVRDPARGSSFDPWIEVDPAALAANAREVARVSGGRPILAVVKNNAYGLGLEHVGPILDRVEAVRGLAVVKTDEAVRLREAGVRKPVLLMARAGGVETEELVQRGISLAPFSDGDDERLAAVSRRLQRPVPVHLYLDTGMGRLGMPYHRALPWIESMSARSGVRVEGTFMGFTEDRDFDREQLRRFIALAGEARGRGLELGTLHAASSQAVTFLPEAHLDMVRPGLMLFGAHVAGGREAGVARLTPALRLRARVVRVERLRPGDSVSYGRNYVAEEEMWIATLPVGHADGYPRQAVEGCRVLVGERTYPVIGAVSASHTIVEVGPERTVESGDVATLLGSGHPDIHPNEVSLRTGRSVYDILMHLNPGLPRRTVE
jgi:alanine racemase